MTLGLAGAGGAPPIPGLSSDGQTPGGVVVRGGVDVNDNTDPSNGSYFGGFTQFFDTAGTIAAGQHLVLIDEALPVPASGSAQKSALAIVRQGDISAADYSDPAVHITDATLSLHPALLVSKASGSTAPALDVVGDTTLSGNVAVGLTLTVTGGVSIDLALQVVKGIGVFGHAPPATQVVLATGAAHTVDDVITLLQSYGLCKQS